MRRTNSNLMLCSMVFVTCLVTANCVTAKTVQTGIPFAGSTILIPSAVICYALTFLATDVIGEVWGAKEAGTTVRWGFVCQVISSLLILVAQALPAADDAMQASFEMLLGQNGIFVLGSMVGYLCSQSWDVYVFHRIRNWFRTRDPKGFARHRWVWNNASTMTSQAIDTVLFIGIAFGVGYGWLFDAAMRPTLLGMMVGQYLIKFVIAALDTPFFYLLTRKDRTGEKGAEA